MRSLASSFINTRSILRFCKFDFCRIETAANKLKLALDQQLKNEKQDDTLTELLKIEKYFKNDGWSIQHQDTEVRVFKQLQKYQINSYFCARSPPLIKQQPEQAQEAEDQNKQQTKTDYSETMVCIKGKNSKKLLIARYAISNQYGPMLINIQFSDKKPEQVKSSTQLELHEDFQGPNLNILEFKVQEAVNNFLKQLGLNDQFLQKTYFYGMAYEQKFYVQWLKNLQSIL